MCWLAIPLARIYLLWTQNFIALAQIRILIREYVKAIESLNKSWIFMFTFEFEEGEKYKKRMLILKLSKELQMARHLNFRLEYTLPLVLEKISEQCTEKVSVDIFIEQVFSLESGIGVIEPIVRMKKWDNLLFDQLYVISKGVNILG